MASWWHLSRRSAMVTWWRSSPRSRRMPGHHETGCCSCAVVGHAARSRPGSPRSDAMKASNMARTPSFGRCASRGSRCTDLSTHSRCRRWLTNCGSTTSPASTRRLARIEFPRRRLSSGSLPRTGALKVRSRISPRRPAPRGSVANLVVRATPGWSSRVSTTCGSNWPAAAPRFQAMKSLALSLGARGYQCTGWRAATSPRCKASPIGSSRLSGLPAARACSW
ncbi:unannotated protein [freshwater metagenome]|uniref:Unannotated protein n=1 Tax=freshwater metagenome TaxID=449393 RepID=A0A6J7KM26_9ZZZZ